MVQAKPGHPRAYLILQELGVPVYHVLSLRIWPRIFDRIWNYGLGDSPCRPDPDVLVYFWRI